MAVDDGEDRVVAAEAHVGAGLPARAALADDDVAGDDGLAAGLLDAEAAAFGIATVAGRAAGFLMCHGVCPSGLSGDAGDAQHGNALAVAVLAAAVLPAALLEDDHLVEPVLRDDGGGDGGASHDGGADRDAGFGADGQDVGESNGFAGLAREFLDLQDGVWRDAVLLSAGADDCEHR